MNRTERVTLSRIPLRTMKVVVRSGPNAGDVAQPESDRLSIGTAEGNDLVLTDSTVSRFHVELVHEGQHVRVIDQGSTNGTRVGSVRLHNAHVPVGTTLTLGNTDVEIRDGGLLDAEVADADEIDTLVGESALMRRLMLRLKKAASSDISALIVGESGTGKELAARVLHDHSPRKEAPFVTVDCGGVPPTLIASSLFGHERGAFTGAHKRHIGAFERANHGTVFLDEIGEISESVQAALLGVLERRRFQRLGGDEEIQVDVRVVSATNRDLRGAVNRGTFRLDLYYRLAVVSFQMPALRERRDDIEPLATFFLREAGYPGTIGDLISTEALESLKKHDWPGNVRELRNLVEATLAMGEPPEIEHGVRGADDDSDPIDDVLALPYKDARHQLLTSFEKRYLGALIERTGGNVSKAARQAGIDRSHLDRLLKRHDLK